jgi:diketogulonate reductase-like aldo/keto reductase
MRPVPSTVSAYGVRMPCILYGTAWKKERTAALVETAVRLGFRGIDTACQPKHYHEPGVGAGVAACLREGLRREEFYLQTKFTPADGQDPVSIPYDPETSLAGQVRQSCAVSLRNLRTDYIDCLLLHSPLQPMARLVEVWRAMEALFAAGTVRQLGISNCYRMDVLRALCRTAEVRPAVVQNRLYATTGYDREIREYCLSNRMFYQSFWTLTANAHVLGHRVVRNLALAYDVSPAQVFFRALSHIGVIPLTGTTSAEHMRQDLAIFEFDLKSDEYDAVTALLRA